MIAWLRKLVQTEPEPPPETLAKQLALLDVQSRMLALLRSLGEPRSDGSCYIAQLPSQQQIGERVGASRSMINRVMREQLTGLRVVRAFAREPFERIARFASGLGGGGAPSGLLGLFEFARSHPYLGATASLLAGRLRHTVAGRWAIRGLALGAAVLGIVWVLGRKGHRD